jgi:hypothetical protein
MKDLEIEQYITRFNELSGLVPHLVTPEDKRVDRFVYGLTPDIRRDVMTSRPTTLQDASVLAKQLARDVARSKPQSLKTTTNSGKRKAEGTSGSRDANDQNKEAKVAKTFAITTPETQATGYVGNFPKCDQCNFHHSGNCPVCTKCNKKGHIAKYCKVELWNVVRSCYECGAPDHFRPQCPRLNQNQQNRNPQNNQNFQQQPIQQNQRVQQNLPRNLQQPQQFQQQQQNPARPARARVFALDAAEAQPNP